jgi:hypothetical protein
MRWGIAGMDETSLRALLGSAVGDEPPIEPLGRKSLRDGIRLRRRARMRRAASVTAVVAVVAAIPAVSAVLGNRSARNPPPAVTVIRIGALTDPGSTGVNAAAFSPDGKMLATADQNGSTYLWNVSSHSRLAALPDPSSNGVH